jgi:hypothetical protein
MQQSSSEFKLIVTSDYCCSQCLNLAHFIYYLCLYNVFALQSFLSRTKAYYYG